MTESSWSLLIWTWCSLEQVLYMSKCQASDLLGASAGDWGFHHEGRGAGHTNWLLRIGRRLWNPETNLKRFKFSFQKAIFIWGELSFLELEYFCILLGDHKRCCAVLFSFISLTFTSRGKMTDERKLKIRALSHLGDSAHWPAASERDASRDVQLPQLVQRCSLACQGQMTGCCAADQSPLTRCGIKEKLNELY